MNINDNIKKCPFCAEKINIRAKKCRFCKEWLQKNNTTACSDGLKKEKPSESSPMKCKIQISTDKKEFLKNERNINREISEYAEGIKCESVKKWYKKWWGVVIAIFILPFFALWYVWTKSKLNTSNKWVMSVIIIFLILIIASNSGSLNKKEDASKSQQAPKQFQVQEIKGEISSQKEDDKKARQEKEEQARILASEEAEKKKEERKKAQAQAEEDKRSAQSEKYCAKRTDDSTSFTVFDVSHISTENKTRRYSMEGLAHKKGPQLTANDCRKIIDFMHGWGIEKIQEISERKYWIGMSSIELTLSAGIPNDINTDNYGSGERGQWIYHKDSYGIKAYYFYVENNKVTAYQDF